MTTREEIIALRNECDEFAEQTLQCKGEFPPDFHAVSDERLYAIAHEAGAASRDAEIDQLRAELEYDQRNAAMSQSESARLLDENTKLRTELVKALAACKAKDEALLTCQPGDCSTGHVIHPSFDERLVESALAIQPDDSALKAWLGEPVAEVDDSGVVIVCRYDYKPKDKFYSPKGLK